MTKMDLCTRRAFVLAFRCERRTRKHFLFLKVVSVITVINILFMIILTNNTESVNPDFILLTGSPREATYERLDQINYSSNGKFGIDIEEKKLIQLPVQKTTLSKYNASTNSTNLSRYRRLISMSYSENKHRDFSVSVSHNPYLIRNPAVCENITDLALIVLVTSAFSHFGRRKFVRQTWGNSEYYGKNKIKVVFLVGETKLGDFKKMIQREINQHNDIVQGTFLDRYQNLTHKTILGLRWVTEHCPVSRFILKVDDDVFVNLFEILKRIEGEYRNKTMEIFCHIHRTNGTVIERGSDSKYTVPGDYFPGMSLYPFQYCSGFFNILTSDVAPVLYEAAKRTPFFPMEDVYLTGIVRAISGDGIKLSYIHGLADSESDAVQCYEIHGKNCKLVGTLFRRFSKIRLRLWDYSRMYNVEVDVANNTRR